VIFNPRNPKLETVIFEIQEVTPDGRRLVLQTFHDVQQSSRELERLTTKETQQEEQNGKLE
jgi:hypothetical protein